MIIGSWWARVHIQAVRLPLGLQTQAAFVHR